MSSSPIDLGDKTPKRRAISGHFNIALSKDEWITGVEILDPLRREIPFDLDPCAHPEQPWPTAREMWSLPERDGLAEPWPVGARVWLNPPFSQVEAWTAKLATHGVGTAICLAGLETRWFVESVWRRATALLLLYKRPHFHAPDGRRAPYNCGKGCVLVAFGEADAAILRACGLPGRFLRLADTVELPSDPARGDGPWPAGIELLQAMERLERIEDREARVADALAEADDAGDEEQARHHAEMAEIDAKLARREAETVNAPSARLAAEDPATLREVERRHANAEAALREFRRAAGRAGTA